MHNLTDTKTNEVYYLDWSYITEPAQPDLGKLFPQEVTICRILKRGDTEPIELGKAQVIRKRSLIPENDEPYDKEMARYFSLKKLLPLIYPSRADALQSYIESLQDLELDEDEREENIENFSELILDDFHKTLYLENKRMGELIWSSFCMMKAQPRWPMQSKQKPQDNGTTTSIEARTEASH